MGFHAGFMVGLRANRVYRAYKNWNFRFRVVGLGVSDVGALEFDTAGFRILDSRFHGLNQGYLVSTCIVRTYTNSNNRTNINSNKQ